MGLDLRWPIGLMFALLGALLFVYGVATAGDPMYERSLGHNVNLLWGAALFAFGTTLLLFIHRRRRPTADAGGPTTPPAADR